MKAVLLAAGLGTRLAPLTDATPKCLLPIGNQTLLDIWLDAFAGIGVQEVLVNAHHLAHLVASHLSERKNPAIRLFVEPQLLGSAGTLFANRWWLANEDLILVVNADNLTDFDLRELIDFHQSGNALATITTFQSDRPSECGIVRVDENRWITEFIEKPTDPCSNLANAGLYAFHPDVLDYIGPEHPQDIGHDLLPKLIGHVRAMPPITGYFRDIGTPDSYHQAQLEWQKK